MYIDIRLQEVVKGRSINLALSRRGRDALKEVGMEEYVTENGIPMYARMIHDLDGTRRPIPYGTKDQVCLMRYFLCAHFDAASSGIVCFSKSCNMVYMYKCSVCYHNRYELSIFVSSFSAWHNHLHIFISVFQTEVQGIM